MNKNAGETLLQRAARLGYKVRSTPQPQDAIARASVEKLLPIGSSVAWARLGLGLEPRLASSYCADGLWGRLDPGVVCVGMQTLLKGNLG